MPRFRKLVESSPYLLAQAINSLDHGKPLARRLTRAERHVIAVAACQPKHHLTIDSKLGRSQFMREFAKLKQWSDAQRSDSFKAFLGSDRQQPHGLGPSCLSSGSHRAKTIPEISPRAL